MRSNIQFAIRLLMVAAAAIPARAIEREHPNVVFIMVDDLGWSDVGYNGSKVYETPNVDRLARQGMVFTDFYTGGPVCSPTRASIMTGKYTARTGITTYLISPDRDADHVTSHLPLEEFTIAEAFKKNGYATGYVGKWHLGYENRHWATQQGFDIAKGGIDLPRAWQLCYPDREAPTAKTWPDKHTRFFSPYHLTHLENGPDGEYLTERLTDEMMAFIEQHRDERFFAFLSFHTVHTPLQAKPETIEKYRRKIVALGLEGKKEKDRLEKELQNNAAYAAMVQHMDENVGRLLKQLDELKLSDKTIVVWTSDNGGKGSVTSNLPLRGMKHNLYEGGIRVPLIVRWSGKIAAGSRTSIPLISNDFYPTLLGLVGCAAEPRQHVDGISFRDVLLGESDTVNRKAIYWHYPHHRQEAAVREGRYKLLHRFQEDHVELYDLATDIGERKDLSQEQPQLASRLLGMLKNWQRSVGARFDGDVIERSVSRAPKKPPTSASASTQVPPKSNGLEPLHPAEDKPLVVRSPPDELKADPFYEKYVDANGYPILASGSVNDHALKEAAFLVNQLLAQRPDLKRAMVASGSRLLILAHDEFTTHLPEFAHMKPKDFWDARARGTGGSRTDPYCSCGEENLLDYPGDPYAAECILIHEFAHNIHLRGMVNLDPTFDERLKRAYKQAMERGLWKDKYASVNHHEYFAEGVQSWFNNNRPPDHDHNHVNSREELIEYDPGLAEMCREVFGDTKLVYTKPLTRLRDHLAGYDPHNAPIFRWPARLKKAREEILR